MDIQNITHWASPEIKTIELSQSCGSTYKVEVREFIPVEEDMLDVLWSDEGVLKTYRLPPYALVNIDKAAQARKQFIFDHVGSYFNAVIKKTEPLLWNTYVMAFQHSKKALVGSHELLSTSNKGSLTSAI
jgi:hypothetical protein